MDFVRNNKSKLIIKMSKYCGTNRQIHIDEYDDIEIFEDSDQESETEQGSELASVPNITRQKVAEFTEPFQIPEGMQIHMRVHPTLDFDYPSFVLLIDKLAEWWIIVEEIKASRRHFHVVTVGIHIDSLRTAWLAWKPKTMEGNKFYSMAEVRKSLTDIVTYVLKPENKNRLDKKVEYEGFPEDFIVKCRTVAYAKYDSKVVAKEFEELDRAYLVSKSRRDVEEWIRGFLEIKVRYNQRGNEKLMDERIHMLRLKKDKHYFDQYVDMSVARSEAKIKPWDRLNR